MTKNKMVHTRIDENLHTKIFEKCNELGCTLSDFIVNSLENSLENEPEINNLEPISQKIEPISQKIEPISQKIEPTSQKTEPTETPKAIIKRISYDGKTWIDMPQN